jgi:hypothetical protein
MEGLPPTEEKEQIIGDSESVAAEVIRSPEGLPEIEVDFIYVNHSLESLEKIWRKVEESEAEVLLIETVGDTKENREIAERALNVVAQSRNEGAGEEDQDNERLLQSLREVDSIQLQLGARAAEKGVAVFFIDIPQESPTYERVERCEAIESEINDLVVEGNIEGALELWPSLIEAQAREYREREEIVTNQVEGFTKRLQNSASVKKVAVIQGAVHTPTYHEVKRRFKGGGNSVKARYTLSETPFIFGPRMSLVRRRRLFPERDVPEEEYRRSLLSAKILFPGVEDIRPDISRPEALALSTEIASKLSAPEVEQALSTFSQDQRRSALAVEMMRLPEGTPKEEEERIRTRDKDLEAAANAAKIARELAAKHSIPLEKAGETSKG